MHIELKRICSAEKQERVAGGEDFWRILKIFLDLKITLLANKSPVQVERCSVVGMNLDRQLWNEGSGRKGEHRSIPTGLGLRSVRGDVIRTRDNVIVE